MIFEYVKEIEPTKGKVFYYDFEGSFVFIDRSPIQQIERIGYEFVAPLLIETLQVEVDIVSGLLLYVNGYYPLSSENHSIILPPESKDGGVRIGKPFQLYKGVGMDISENAEWYPEIDQQSGWVRIKDKKITGKIDYVRFASDTIIGLSDGAIDSLWLHPMWIKTIDEYNKIRKERPYYPYENPPP